MVVFVAIVQWEREWTVVLTVLFCVIYSYGGPERAMAVLLGSTTGIMPLADALVSAIIFSVIRSAAGELQSGSFAHLL